MTAKTRKAPNEKQKQANREHRAALIAKRQSGDYQREKLNGAQAIGRIQKQLRAILKGDETIDLEARRLVLDSCFKILKHTVPTLKAVEITGHDGPLEVIVRLPDIDAD